MNGVRSEKSVGGPSLQLFICTHASCGATFTRQWRLNQHETVHTGAVRKRVHEIISQTFKLLESIFTILNVLVNSARASAQSLTVVAVSQESPT